MSTLEQTVVAAVSEATDVVDPVPPVSKPARPQGRVISAVFNYGLGSFLPQIVNMLLIPVYADKIPTDQFGVLELCLSAQALVIILMRAGLPGAISRSYFDLGEGQELRNFIVTVVLTTIVASAVLLAGCLTLGPMFFAWQFPEVPFHPYMDLALVGGFFLAVADFQRRLLQAREQSKLSARLSITIAVVSIALTCLFVIGFNWGIVGVLLSALISSIVFAGYAVWLHWSDLHGRPRWKYLKEAAGYGLPLVPHHAAAWLQQFVGRWALADVATTAMVGTLGMASRVASPLMIVTGAFGNAYSPVYFSWRSNLSKDDALAESRRVARAVVALGGIAAVGAATFGALVVRTFMPLSYENAAAVTGVVAAAYFAHLIYAIQSVEVFFTKNTKWISLVFFFASVFNLVLTIPLGKQYGAAGAALAQLAGGLLSCLLIGMLTRKTFPSPLTARLTVAMLLCCGFASVIDQILPHGSLKSDAIYETLAFVGLTIVVLLTVGSTRELFAEGYALLGFSTAKGQAKSIG
jgi:O-antigen/teichoic acid export membrane protein